MRRILRALWAVLGLTILLGTALGCSIAYHSAERRFLSTGPNGSQTPQSLGLPFERLRIVSGDRVLDGYLVRAPAIGRPETALLVFHGRGETISDWVGAMRVLYDHGISSMVFDYSGHGDSSGPGSIRHLNADAAAAYDCFVSRFPTASRCVLGFSMGNAPMLHAMVRFEPDPSAVVVGAAFSSLRGLLESRPRWWAKPLARCIPDAWNNVKSIARSRAPILILHSDADRADPLDMGQQLFRAAPEPKEMVVLHGMAHNAPFQDPEGGWWEPVIRFVLDPTQHDTPPQAPGSP
jgi:alpha-beta hydrolase superfamily lysophospholipase